MSFRGEEVAAEVKAEEDGRSCECIYFPALPSPPTPPHLRPGRLLGSPGPLSRVARWSVSARRRTGKGERILLRYGFPIYSFLYPHYILSGATVGFTVAAELWLQILSRGHRRLLGRPRETPFQGNTFSEGVAPHTLSFAPALPPWMEDRGRMARPQASAQLKMKHGKVTL